jgi:outer membrane protein OmpA-like peptidoglycan-associated protein
MLKNTVYCFCFIFVFHASVLPLIGRGQVRGNQDQAEQLFSAGKYKEALPIFSYLLTKTPKSGELNFFTGLCYFNLPGGVPKSISFFEKGRSNPHAFFYYDLQFYLGQAYHLTNRFDEAIAAFEIVKHGVRHNKSGDELLRDIRHRIEMCNYAKTLTINPKKVTIINVGNGVNSEYQDYAPIISADEHIMIFTSRRKGSTGGMIDENGEYYEDIYTSTNSNGNWTSPVKIDSAQQAKVKPNWSKARKLSAGINTNKHDAAIGLSADAQKLFIYRNEDVYMSSLNGSDWGKPVKLNANINSKFKEPSASLSADENTLFFVSDRKGGYGGKDIYRSQKNEKGEWETAVNLGPVINTAYDEEAPFIQSDGKTLYFSSKGHTSMGGYDIFKSVFDTKWSAPENIGYPINTSGDDIYYVVSAKGDHGYFSSLRAEGLGGMDIYLVNYEGVSVPLTEVKGLVLEGDSLRPAASQIEIVDVATNQKVGLYNSNSQSGKYLLIFPPGKNYKMTIRMKGYLPHTELVYIPDQKTFYQLYQEIHFQHLKSKDGHITGQSVKVENAFFDINKYVHSDSALFNVKDSIAVLSALHEFKNKNNATKATSDTLLYSEKIRSIEYTPSDSLVLLAEIQNALAENQRYPDTNSSQFKGNSSNDKNLSSFRMPKGKPSPDTKSGGKLILNFEHNSFILTEISFTTLDSAVTLLQKNKNFTVSIFGHTDNIGKGNYNILLGLERASAVKHYLIKNGVNYSRIKTKSFGEFRPNSDNNVEDGRRLNRRAEVIINK